MIIRSTYAEQVVSYIKEKILTGELKPGDWIKENLLAEELNISRAPIREALLELTHAGIVESKSRVGKSVVSFTSQQILQSYVTGGVLEGFALASSLHLFTERDFADLESIVNNMEKEATQGGNAVRLSQLDHDFHDKMYSKTDNDLLVELSLRASRGISQFLFFHYWMKVFSPDEIYRRHAEFLSVVRQGGQRQVEDYVRGHYEESGQRMSRFGSDVFSPDTVVLS